MVAFLVLMGLGNFVSASSEYWIYPAQTILCGALLLWFWREYEFGSAREVVLTSVLALMVFVVWIAPPQFLGFPPRLDGFNPDRFSGQPALYWSTIGLRFLRLVVVVPLIEEIFFRGFLLRYFVREQFHTVPMGTFSWLSFAVVSIAFALVHKPADWVAALIAGAIYNGVAYRTNSLASCVLAHAITNLLLGIWIMKTGQWGFW